MERALDGAQIATRPSVVGDERDGSLREGARVGRYVVLEEVGSGAMGTVYAALDPDLDRRVALKILRTRTTTDELRARLLREAKAMARITHPEVITVYDVGTRGAQLFVAMELVQGGTLRTWCSQGRGWRPILAKYLRAGRGLAFAHAAGVVHRDFKPDNVLVGDDDRVRVTDFGLARAVVEEEPSGGRSASTGGEPLDATLTRTGAIVGTPAYMAPEQLALGPATPASDQFSFCVALYEALYAERPFVGVNIATLRAAATEGNVRPAPPSSLVPRRLRTALLRGLRAAPEQRYPSMTALLEALESAARPSWSRPQVSVVALVGVVGAGSIYALARPSRPVATGANGPVLVSAPPSVAAPINGTPLAVPATASADEAPASPAPSGSVIDRAPARAPAAPRRDVTRARPRATTSPTQPAPSSSGAIAALSPATAAPPSTSVGMDAHGVPILP